MRSTQEGFTLVEMMIAVALFTIVMTIGIGAVLNANGLYKKTSSMRAITDNLSFVMEDMTRSIRLGQNFRCPGVPITTVIDSSTLAVSQGVIDTDPNLIQDCPSGTLSVAFDNADPSTGSPNGMVGYLVRYNGIFKTTDGGVTYRLITPPEVVLDDGSNGLGIGLSGFEIIGAKINDNLQPRITIRLSGMVKDGEVSSPFSLQTTVSPRLLDAPTTTP